MHKFRRDKNSRINQGDVFKKITHIENWEEFNGELKIYRYHYPYIVVLSQDCDLREDASVRVEGKNDKALVSVLVAPIYNFDLFLEGTHLRELGIKAHKIAKNPKKSDHKNIIQNNNPRYHYLEFEGLSKSIIDFKHYFSLSSEYLQRIKKDHFEYPIPFLYRELLCQRFANYLSRIGLPA